jgi:hypothetical protein
MVRVMIDGHGASWSRADDCHIYQMCSRGYPAPRATLIAQREEKLARLRRHNNVKRNKVHRRDCNRNSVNILRHCFDQ